MNIDFLDPDYKRYRGYVEVISEATGINKQKVEETAALVGCSTVRYTDIADILKALKADVLDPPTRRRGEMRGIPSRKPDMAVRRLIIAYIKWNPGKLVKEIKKALKVSHATVEYAATSDPNIYEDDDGCLYFDYSVYT